MPHEKDQTHWHEPTGTRKAGFGEFKKQPTPYDAFMESEGIPVFRGIGIRKVQDLPLAPWKRTGGRGHYIQLHGTETKWGCYIVEIPPAGALNPERHMYEEIFLVVEGRGTTEVWQEGDARKHVFEWQKGSMFSIPMNAWHRLVNATSGGALLLAGTTAPNVLNMINNVGAVFDNPFVFRDRFNGADDFFKPKDDIEPDPVRGLAMRRTNFIPDIVNCDLPLDNRRSPGWRRVEPFMTDNCFYFWIGQHENGRYSKGHAHTSAAVLICVKGKGYTYTWPERLGVTPWKDGRMEGPVPPHRLVRPAQPRARSGPAGREGDRLHRHGHPGRRHVHSLLDGGPVHPPGVRRNAREERSAEPHGAGLVRSAEKEIDRLEWARRPEAGSSSATSGAASS